MTLLLTEIHPSAERPFIIFAADGRITRNGQASGRAQKILPLTNLPAAIGYFGLAEVRGEPMFQWLHNWAAGFRPSTLGECAYGLAKQLNSSIPAAIRKKYISGFHIAGFADSGNPEFWFVRNVDDDRETLLDDFEAREDFKRRDVTKLPHNGFQVYRNGDIRAHVIAWESIDNGLLPLLSFPEFSKIQSAEAYARWVKFKLQVVALFYKRFCNQSIIGTPINVLFIERGSEPTPV